MENENQQPQRQPSPDEIVLLEAKSTFEVLTAGMAKLIHDLAQIRDHAASQQAVIGQWYISINELSDRINVQTHLIDQLNERLARLEPHGRVN
jgi:hypothetical protein